MKRVAAFAKLHFSEAACLTETTHIIVMMTKHERAHTDVAFSKCETGVCY